MTRQKPLGCRSARDGSNPDMRAILTRYVRYATLIRYQEEALDREDLDRFEELAQARDALQEELKGAPPIPDPDELDPDCREYLDRILENFRDTLHLDARLRARLQKMKNEASLNLKTMDGRGGQVRGCLEGDENKLGKQSGRFNVRL